MPKLCVIGNSHIAAVLAAWKHMSPPNGLTADFFAQHTNSLIEASLAEDGSLLPGPKPFLRLTAEGGRDRSTAVDLEPYDATMLVGLAFGPIAVLRTYRKYSYFGLKGRNGQVVPREHFKRAVLHEMNEGAGLHIAALIRQKTDKPILLVPTPLPGEDGYTTEDMAGMRLWRHAADAGDGAALMQVYAEVCLEVEKRDITVMPQPAETLATPISTLRVFADGAVRATNDEIRAENDNLHMNALYGQAIWRDVLTRLDAIGD